MARHPRLGSRFPDASRQMLHTSSSSCSARRPDPLPSPGSTAPRAPTTEQPRTTGGVSHVSARCRRFASGRLAALALALPSLALAQRGQTLPVASVPIASAARDIVTDTSAGTVESAARPTVPTFSRFRSTADSVAHERTRELADRATGLRVIVLLEDRQLAVMRGADTLMVAPVATGMDTTITYGAKSWTFETPRGPRKVLRKEKDPVWVPPEWHYAEVAGKRGLELQHLSARKPTRLADGRSLVVRNGRVGVLDAGAFTALPADEEIVFDGTLFIPPHGTANRRIPGELGRFKLDMGNGYLLHGTPYENTIGDAATHGCVRLYDEDIAWLYQNVPVGTPVFIY